ncbi:MAG TPA: 3-phosphoshikimate 1-carboxyvinyltransferase [Thermoanaerobaculia bacterium]|nr:3-phosphoshikimate 1-carboxyvinyltransferase [Thermoanaerobaculia bacterium]
MTDSFSQSTTPTEPIAVPSGRRTRGRLRVPSSKSLTHRYLNLALLSGAPVVIERPLFAEDTRLFLAALGRCGFQVAEEGDDVRLIPAERPAGEVEIFCGNAGTMLRFLVATLTVVPGLWRLDGIPRLRERPVGPLVEALRRLGARIEYVAAEGYVPLRIEGGTLRGGTTTLDAGESSQYLSALLMAALRAPGEVVVEVPTLTSRPYVDVTIAAASAFDGHIERAGPRAYRVRPSALRGGRARVEGDYSAACYPAAAAALTGGEVILDGLSPDSRQGDREFIDLLAEMGAEVRLDRHGLTVAGTGRIRGLTADLHDVGELTPVLAALAALADSPSELSGIGHLRGHETDRLAALCTELTNLGGDVVEESDGLAIRPRPLHGGTWHAYADHRMATAGAVLGLVVDGIAVDDIASTTKTLPDFPGMWSALLDS